MFGPKERILDMAYIERECSWTNSPSALCRKLRDVFHSFRTNPDAYASDALASMRSSVLTNILESVASTNHGWEAHLDDRLELLALAFSMPNVKSEGVDFWRSTDYIGGLRPIEIDVVGAPASGGFDVTNAVVFAAERRRVNNYNASLPSYRLGALNRIRRAVKLNSERIQDELRSGFISNVMERASMNADERHRMEMYLRGDENVL